MSDYDIRPPRDEAERLAAYRMRYDLYVTGQGLFGDTADHERKILTDAADEHAFMIVAVHEGKVVGTARFVQGGGDHFTDEDHETFDVQFFTKLVDEREIGIGSRLLVDPDHRNSPLPALLISRLFEELVEQGIEVLLADCEPHLVNKWSGLGFRPYGMCEHPTNGTLIRLALISGDTKYFKNVRSPLLPVASKWTKDGFTPRRLAGLLARSQRVVSEAKDSELFWAAVEDTLSLEQLAALLGGLNVAEFDALLGNSHALDCDPGAALIRKGHASRTLYVLLTGTLEVRDGDRHLADVTEPGAVVGEVALFAHSKRTSDVVAGEHGARVLALSERNIKALIEAQGVGAAKFLLTLTRGLSCKLVERAHRQAEDSIERARLLEGGGVR